MMLDDFPSIQRSETYNRDNGSSSTALQINSSLHLLPNETGPAPNYQNIIATVSTNTAISSNYNTSTHNLTTRNKDQQTERSTRTTGNSDHLGLYNQHQVSHQDHLIQTHPLQFSSIIGSNQNHSYKFNSIIAGPSRSALGIRSSSSLSSMSSGKSDIQTYLNIGNMNVGDTQHANMTPAAHNSDHQSIQYSANKNLSDSSPSSMALNYSHDLSQQQQQQQSAHQDHSGIHQLNNEGNDVKPQLSGNSFELDSGSVMQSAAVGMNMWKNSVGLNPFKHPVIAEHNFATNSDLNSFSTWPHNNNLCHQTSSMTHTLLDGQLISYPPHQRSVPIPTQDIVGVSMKGQSPADQASYMLNSINHQTPVSQSSSSSHQTTQQTLENLNLRPPHPLDHSASYNLSMNDGQFYNSSRSESRSHQNVIKPPFMMADRTTVMTLGNHQTQLPYHNAAEHGNLQPTTSQLVAGSSSSGTSSKDAGSFKCPTCNEVFPLRTVYQSHLKTHSQDKGSKAKFQCELCGHSFSQKTSLNRHMKSHTGERPFPCEICSKAFSEKERLKIHMRTHTGEKPFTCTICGKSFSQKSTVKRHQTVHTGEKKFRCDCGKGFANRGNLIAHIKTRGSNHFE